MKKETLVILIVLIFAILALFIINVKSKDPYSSKDNKNPILEEVRYNFSLLNPKYANIPLREGNSAYTENKRTITLCLKNPETKEYYSMNTIMYVALHELGHVVSKSQGHTEEFKEKFSILLREAARLGIYNPRKEIPQTYCGIGPED